MSYKNFCHLWMHSDFSIVDGISKVKAIAKKASELEMPAVALTDYMSLYGAIKFYKECKKNKVKPIIGAELYITTKLENEGYTLLALAKNNSGYKSIIKLITLAYERGYQDQPFILEEEFFKYAKDVIIILTHKSSFGISILENKPSSSISILDKFKDAIKDDLYVGITNNGFSYEKQYAQTAFNIAQEKGIYLLALNNNKFTTKAEYESHNIKVAINQKTSSPEIKNAQLFTPEQYFKSQDEMLFLFNNETILENTFSVAKKCNLLIEIGTYHLPNFPIPKELNMSSEHEYLVYMANQGLEKRLKSTHNPKQYEEEKSCYQERLDYELRVIENMGFPGYFLIVMEFISWSKENGVPVGPGRGSGAGSLVAYSLGITDLDPIRFGLIFERFLNEERVSMPDFDVDFGTEERDLVIEHVSDTYGHNAVSQIITFGTFAARAAIKDAGRALSYSYGFSDRIAKLVPMTIGMSIQEALKEEPLLREMYDSDEEVQALVDEAINIEGVVRNVGTHAGGVVIAPSALTDYTAIYCDKYGQHPVTQYDKGDVEDIGLVKFDFLGLKNLTIIKWALDSINKDKAPEDKLDISKIPLDDKKSFEMLMSGHTAGIFQLESDGMVKIILDMMPDRFEDITALVALYRPGPIQSGMVTNFTNRKKGIEKVSYPDPDFQHELLKPILDETYGIILYQEQVMQIAQVLAGYSLGGADILRRAMGKKKPEEMAKQRSVFEYGAVQNGIDSHLAMKIFDLVEKFAGYGFNKSHSAAYALVAYQTLYLKTHYGSYFMAASLSSELDDQVQIKFYYDETIRLGIKIHNPTINGGQYRFIALDNETISYGLGAVKGVGEDIADAIYKEFVKSGPYKDLYDFIKRLKHIKLNKKNLEGLIKAGAMDCFNQTRSTLIHNISTATELADKEEKDNSAGQISFLTDFEEDISFNYKIYEEYPVSIKLDYEYDILGIYLSGHPLKKYLGELRRYTDLALKPEFLEEVKVPRGSYKDKSKYTRKIGGIITHIYSKIAKKSGKKIYLLDLDDSDGKISIMLFAELGDKYLHILNKNNIIVLEGVVEEDRFNGGVKFNTFSITSLNELREKNLSSVSVKLNKNQMNYNFLTSLSNMIYENKGETPFEIDFISTLYNTKIGFKDSVKISPTLKFITNLENLVGEQNILMSFK